jgi:hypothetical protein
MFHLSLWSCDNQATIKHWRSKMRVLNRETEERNRLLQEEKHSIQRHYQQLKHRIKLYRCVPRMCGVCVCSWCVFMLASSETLNSFAATHQILL